MSTEIKNVIYDLIEEDFELAVQWVMLSYKDYRPSYHIDEHSLISLAKRIQDEGSTESVSDIIKGWADSFIIYSSTREIQKLEEFEEQEAYKLYQYS